MSGRPETTDRPKVELKTLYLASHLSNFFKYGDVRSRLLIQAGAAECVFYAGSRVRLACHPSVIEVIAPPNDKPSELIEYIESGEHSRYERINVFIPECEINGRVIHDAQVDIDALLVSAVAAFKVKET